MCRWTKGIKSRTMCIILKMYCISFVFRRCLFVTQFPCKCANPCAWRLMEMADILHTPCTDIWYLQYAHCFIYVSLLCYGEFSSCAHIYGGSKASTDTHDDIIMWAHLYITGPLCDELPVTGRFPSQRANSSDLEVCGVVSLNKLLNI